MKIVKHDVQELTSKYPDAVGLVPHLERVERGSKEDFRTPLFKKSNPSQVLSDWMDVLTESPLITEDLLKYEKDQYSKAGPLSQYSPLKEIRKDVLSYFEPGRSITIDQSLMERAKLVVAQLIFGNNLNRNVPKTPEAVVEHSRKEGKLRTNSALPFFKRRNEVIQETIKLAKERNTAYPAVLGTAGYAWKKTRKFWMVPFHVNVWEQQYQQVVTPLLKVSGFQTGILSASALNASMTKMLNQEGFKFNTDFVHMDENFKEELRNHVRDVVKFGFQRQYASDIDKLYEYTSNIPLIISTTEMITGSHGEASGLGFTNGDESIIQAIIWVSLALSYSENNEETIKIDTKSSTQNLSDPALLLFQVVGDDGSLYLKNQITVNDVISHIEKFGFTAEPTKQNVSTKTLIYLRKMFSTDYGSRENYPGVYPTMRALNSCVRQKRFFNPDLWSSKMVIMRTLQILEICNEHPLFYKFVDYVKSGDRDGLGTTIPGFYESLSKTLKEYKEIPGAMDTYTQEQQEANKSPQSVYDWKVVKYLWNR